MLLFLRRLLFSEPDMPLSDKDGRNLPTTAPRSVTLEQSIIHTALALFLRRLLYTEPVLPFQTTTDAPLLLRPRGPGDVKQTKLRSY